MRLLGHWILYWLMHAFISLRFRIRVKGMDTIKPEECHGALITPNHPAEIDPIILILALWPRFRPRPLVVENFYFQKGMRFWMDLVDSLPVPSMDIANPWKVRQIEKLKKKVIDEINAGRNILIYPSGRLKTTPEEQVGGASMVHELLQKKPDMKILLVRTTGLWGSRFSRGLTGGMPDFATVAWQEVKIMLKNGIFFAPRREVTVEVEWAPADFPRKGERLEINKAFEKWFNKNGPEPLKLVSNVFWKEEFPEVKAPEKKEISLKEIPKEVYDEVLGQLAKVTRRPVDQLKPEMNLSNDLGLDSLDVAQFYIFLENRFGISPLVPGQLQTVAELLEAAAGHAKEVEGAETLIKRTPWPHQGARPLIEMPSGETLQEVFLKSCARMGGSTACADQTSGALSYRKLKMAAYILSVEMAKLEGEQIGVMLPASIAAYVTVLAILLAGKVPVMLNWTAGERSIEHSAKLCQLKAVITSYRFLGRVDGVDLQSIDGALVYLEDVKHDLPLKTKLKGMIHAMRNHLVTVNPDDPAVVIFTSGTETLPKGVPLTHRNLLFDQRAALSCVTLRSDDTLYGVLPPFHSFGFSVTGILALLIGMRICYSPDPTNSRAMASDIDFWKPTLFCCAPSFIQSLLNVAKPEHLESLRLTVTGAEKAPDSLFEAFKKMGKTLIEGYGITECGPIVTIEREGEPHRGVGKPIPGVELKIAEEEEILIHGPNVFHGYLGDVPPPFVERDGKRWYRSGDRGSIEADGTLIVTGRLKRFIKIGGEMVSLGGIEEELMQLAPKKDKPVLAVVGINQNSDKPEIVVVTTFPLNRDQANQFLKDRGHARLAKIADVRQIAEIPLTGTGKTHYRLLDELIQKK